MTLRDVKTRPKSKWGLRIRSSTRGHTYQACHRVRGKASYIGEAKKGATPVLGFSLSASTQCTGPSHQLTRYETLAWGCHRKVEKMSILFAINDRRTMAVAQR
jgi:hypothetical protein